jgi:hypothetical protein
MIPIPDDEDEKLQEALEVSTCEVEFQRGGGGGSMITVVKVGEAKSQEGKVYIL